MDSTPTGLDSYDDRPVGIFDSGLGGLTVLAALRRALPGESFVYLGDTARTPWGGKSPATVLRYSRECVRYLLGHDVKCVVAACNTASAVALPALRADDCPVPVTGVIEASAAAACAAGGGARFGVLGTRATVRSGAYDRALRRLRDDASVVGVECPLFVPLVENGLVAGSLAAAVVEHHLAPFRDRPVDTVVLGCTHYPVLAGLVRARLGDRTRVVDCAAAVAAGLAEMLGGPALRPATPGAGGAVRYHVTDEPERFEELSTLFVPEGLGPADVARLEGVPGEPGDGKLRDRPENLKH